MCGNREGALPSRAGRDYCRAMPALRRLLAVCALALAVVLVALPSTAGAQGYLDIYDDFADNGVIDGDYSFARLQEALIEARQDALYTDFANAVSDTLDAQYLGGGSGGGGGAAVGGSPLPEPRTPDQSGDPPWPFLVLTVLAGALVVTGAGSSIYRRARR